MNVRKCRSPRSARPLARLAAMVAGVALVSVGAHVRAQEAPSEPLPDAAPTTDAAPPSADEARRILSATPPADAPAAARLEAAIRQRAAARVVGDQAAIIRSLEVLVDLGRDRPEAGTWWLDLMNTEFTYGSQQKSLEYGEKMLAMTSLDPVLRSNAAANLAWKYCEVNDERDCERVYAIAEKAYAAIPPATTEGPRRFAEILQLQAKAHVMKARGDADARVATLRDATIAARRYQAYVGGVFGNDTRTPQVRGAITVADYTGGQFVYALIAQGRANEALAVAQEGLARARLAGLGPDSIGAWHHRLAAALVSQQRYADALDSARASVTALRQAGGRSNGLMMALARNSEVVALIGLERWPEADATYTGFLAEIREDKVAYERSYSPVLVALLAAKNNRLDVAVRTVETSYKYRQRVYGGKSPLTMEARGVRGAVNLIAQSQTLAMADYDELFTALLDTSSGWQDLAPVGFRGQYLNLVLLEFLRYAASQYQASGAGSLDGAIVDRLVQVTDRLGTSVAQRSILESTAKLRNGNPALAALLAREQEQRARLREAYAVIFADVLASDAKDLSDERRKQLRAQLKQHRDGAEALQKTLEEIRRDLGTQFPGYLALVNPTNPTPSAIAKVLARDEAFIGIYPTTRGTFVWAVNASGKRTIHVSRWTEQDVAQRVARLRATLDVGDQLPRLPAFDFATALEVYNELVKPVRGVLDGAAVVDVSAAGALGSLPLGALVTAPAQDAKSAPWLVRDFAIAQTPGAAAFVTLRQTQSKTIAARPFLGYGDPQFKSGAPPPAAGAGVRNLVVTANAQQASTYSVEGGFRYANIPALPETRQELGALAAALGADPQQDVVVGAQATRKAVVTTPLADRRVVAFATHGLLPGEIPGQSKPALAMAATDDPAESPLLTLDDVLALKLNAQWVVLSACNTAGAERDGTPMSGLVRGFFYAGTRSVLATHWAVESEASRALVSQLFADAAKDPGRAASLRRVELAMIDGSLGAGRYAHPFYWAPYALFGDPTR